MARTAITVPAAHTVALTYYPVTPLSAAERDLTETGTSDPTDRQTTIVDGKTVVLAHNTDAGAQTVTIASSIDSFNRLGTITAYSIGAGKIAIFGPFKTAGWTNGGQLFIDVSSALVRLSVLTLP